MDVMDVNPQPRPRIILGKEMLAPKGRKWMFSQEKIYEMEKQGLIRLNSKGVPQYKVTNQDFELLDSKWTDIPGYSSTTGFATENSEKLLARVINTGSQTI
jgi:adenine-specific DNA-methyltransferase